MVRVLEASVPTVMVAASDASKKARVLASYRCDGTADDVGIQAAIDSLPSGGGKVVLSEGTFTLAALIDLTTRSDVEIEGVGWATILKMGDGVDAAGVLGGGAVSRIYLHDFQIDGNRANNTLGNGLRFLTGTAADCRIERLYIHDADQRGMSITGDRFHVSHCFIKDCDNAGIGLNSGADGCIIIDNEISSCDGDGIFVGSAQCTIAGNKCHENSDTGINIGGTGGHICIGNECYLNDNSGINTGGASHLIILGNVCFANGRKVDTPRSNAGIRIRDDTGDTQTSKYVVCNGNRCYEDDTTYALPGGALGQLYGIEIDSPAGTKTPDNLIIQGNELTVIDAAPGGWTAILRTDVGSTTAIRNNLGDVTENSGTATLVNGQTSIAVTHGLDVTPVAGDIMVTPIEAWGAMTEFYIDTYTATQFTIHADQDPTQDVDFAWKAVVL